MPVFSFLYSLWLMKQCTLELKPAELPSIIQYILIITILIICSLFSSLSPTNTLSLSSQNGPNQPVYLDFFFFFFYQKHIQILHLFNFSVANYFCCVVVYYIFEFFLLIISWSLLLLSCPDHFYYFDIKLMLLLYLI